MKPVSPIHFFDHRGHSTLSADYLSAENDKLKAEVEELKRKNTALATRLRHLAGDTENSISVNN